MEIFKMFIIGINFAIFGASFIFTIKYLIYNLYQLLFLEFYERKTEILEMVLHLIISIFFGINALLLWLSL